MKNYIKLLITFLTWFGLIFVFSCKEEERNRILNYKKGFYLGKKDQNLDKNLVNNLSQHVNKQNFN